MNPQEPTVGRHEAVFSIFMAAVAFLWQQGGGRLADPALLLLFAALMGVNLAASAALRRWPARRWLAALISLLNCGVVAAIVERSGGADSRFWVLYLLPIYSSCILLGGRETLLIAAGALVLDAAGTIPEVGACRIESIVILSIRSAVLALAAVVTYGLAERERAARDRLEKEREETRKLESLTRLQQLKLQESAGLADTGLFSAGVAHDLNNALAVVVGFAEVAISAEGVPQDVRSDIAGIRRSAKMAKRMAAGLLGLTRRVTLTPEPLDINDILRELLDITRGTLAGARVKVDLGLDTSAPRIVAVRTQLQRLFLNLISNAARAMSASGGRLAITTHTEPTRDGGSQVIVTLEDEGPGIPAPVLASLFQPFAKDGSAEGHGLGLYICWEIARDNGGRLHGENRPEGGARFTLYLPCPQSTLLDALLEGRSDQAVSVA